VRAGPSAEATARTTARRDGTFSSSACTPSDPRLPV
jgi:hypothetical protein